MISDTDIRRAYQDDQRHPYYSVQAGRSHASGKPGRTAASVSSPAKAYTPNPKPSWGHFQAALMRALRTA